MKLTATRVQAPGERAGLLRRSLAGLISTYQRYISPMKGYGCAHRRRHQGPSCSEYVKRLATSGESLMGVVSGTVARFGECRIACEMLNEAGEADCFFCCI